MVYGIHRKSTLTEDLSFHCLKIAYMLCAMNILHIYIMFYSGTIEHNIGFLHLPSDF